MKKIIITTIFMLLFTAISNVHASSIDASSHEKELENGFKINMISNDILSLIHGKSYPVGCALPISDLRYLQVLHYGFDGKVYKGEIIINKVVAQDVIAIFKELYEAKYPIEKMRLIDYYDAYDEYSMEDNNSSAFCFRNINNTTRISNHGKGVAIDINPLYNPYVKGDIVEPMAGKKYAFNRESGHMYYITENDICVKTFAKYGFTWGGNYTSRKDYQHFEKIIDGLYADIESATP